VSLEAAYAFHDSFSAATSDEQHEGLFGPVLEVLDDAPLVAHIAGINGRHPAWTP
jgi:hypothetical protein